MALFFEQSYLPPAELARVYHAEMVMRQKTFRDANPLSPYSSRSEVEALMQHAQRTGAQLEHKPTSVFSLFGQQHALNRDLTVPGLQACLQSDLAPDVRYVFLDSTWGSSGNVETWYYDPEAVNIVNELLPIAASMKRCLTCGVSDMTNRPFVHLTHDQAGHILGISSFTSFWGFAGYATYEWTLSPSGALTVLIANVEHDVQEAFFVFAKDHPQMTRHPLLFDFIVCTERMRFLEHAVIAHVKSIDAMIVHVQPNTKTDVIEASQATMNYIFTLRRWVGMIEPVLDQMERCQRLLSERSDAKIWEDLAAQSCAAASVDLHQLRMKHNECLVGIENVISRAQMHLNLMLHSSNLAESRATQALAQQSRDLAEVTTLLAQQTSRDSASMITIAAVTMFFLPATFVSSLFSMGFFVFDQDGSLKISEMVWIYPAVVVPLTASVFTTWLAWIKLRPNKVQKEVKKLGLNIKRREEAEKSEP